MFDIAIIGGGIVGAATFYKLQSKFPDKKILLIEKEECLADHQTGNNSGVIHSGLYYTPGSHKARNCMSGREELVAFSKKYGVKHDVCGKVVVATNESELPFMDKIFKNGEKNGLTGIEKIGADQIREIEPYCTGIAGIWVPQTGIVDFRGATEKLVEIALSIQPESKLVLGEEAIAFNSSDQSTEIKTSKSSYTSRKLIFCGGLQADRLAKKDQMLIKEKVVGFRGDY